jgi:nucleoside-diphosphate-sugar epimerase
VEANVAAAERAVAPGAVFNVGGGSEVSLNQVIAIVESVSGQRLRIRREVRQKGDVRHTAADCSRARRELAFRPAVTLEQGLRSEWQWIKEDTHEHQPGAA